MPRTRRSTSARHSAEISTIGGTTSVVDQDIGRCTSLFIVIVSLIFVAIFGGALVGGVVTGDPSNKFFITIIAASGVAISIALVVTIRYYCKNRTSDNADDNDNRINKDIRGTFSGSEEDHPDEDDYLESGRGKHRHQHGRQHHHRQSYHGRTPVQTHIKEIQARSVAGEMSALSPHSYDAESLSTRRDIPISKKMIKRQQQQQEIQHHRDPFDFSSPIFSRPSPHKVQAREDPPEGAGQATYYAAWITRGHSQDPDAHMLNEHGEIVSFDEGDDRDIEADDELGLNSFSHDHSITSPQLPHSRYEVAGETTRMEQIPEEDTVVTDQESVTKLQRKGDSVEAKKEEKNSDKKESSTRRDRRRRSRSRSRSASRSRSRSRSRSKSPFNRSSKRNEKISKTPRPPTSTKSAAIISSTVPMTKAGVSGTASAPSTPAASDVGSIASSFFKPLNGLFGKKSNKYASSEAGHSEANSAVGESGCITKPKGGKSTLSVGMANEGKPPMMPEKKRRDAPSTPGNKSVYSIPPPRHIPSTPGGASEIFSEFRSFAGSGAASSTFDPFAHDKALRKMQTVQGHLGASALGDVNSMPVYYEDDDKASSVAPSSVALAAVAYDVFAPSGAIGIVVDTTNKGCIVHSLKKSSPMKGMMNPGDLIIALDDFDVRKMTAASLTKLMAKKSQQPERKFTLVPADYV